MRECSVAADEARTLADLLNGATVLPVGRAVHMGIVELTRSGEELIAVHVQCAFRVLRADISLFWDLMTCDIRDQVQGRGVRAL